jgi:adenylate cyclase
MSSLIAELKRRNVIRVLVAYLAGAWLLIQISDILFPIYGISDATLQSLTTLLAIGLIPAIVLAWVFELTSDGLKRDSDASDRDPDSARSNKSFDRVIIVALVLAVGIFAVDKFVIDPSRDAEMAAEVAAQTRGDMLIESFGDKSIVVLPFANMSSDPEQEYFADGISEELLNLLARIDGLRVISRTSAFQFKGTDKSVTEIAAELNVAYVLEGSVRRAGNTIRITTQLIDARADAHVWSETYDRGMDDIFAIQDEVGAEVVGQLKISMEVGLPTVARHDPRAYPLYLQAAAILQGPGSREDEMLDKADRLLSEALAIDPDYVDAIVSMSWVYNFRAQNTDVYEDNEELVEKFDSRADELLSEAAAIDPDNLNLNIALAWFNNSDFGKAVPYLEKALSLDRNNVQALNTSVMILDRTWRPALAAKIGAYIFERDPLTHSMNNLVRAYINSGQFKLAEEMARTLGSIDPDGQQVRWLLGIALLFQGASESALEQFRTIYKGHPLTEPMYLQGSVAALHALSRHNESRVVLATMIEKNNSLADDNYGWPLMIGLAYAFIGDSDSAFEFLYEARQQHHGQFRVMAHSPFYRNLEDDARWIPFLESIGLAPDQLAAIEFNPRLPVELANSN